MEGADAPVHENGRTNEYEGVRAAEGVYDRAVEGVGAGVHLGEREDAYACDRAMGGVGAGVHLGERDGEADYDRPVEGAGAGVH